MNEKHALTVEAYDIAVTAVAGSIKTMNGVVQLAAVAAVAFSVMPKTKTKSADRANELLAAVRAGNPHLVNTLVSYLEAFGNFKYDTKAKAMTFCNIGQLTSKPQLTWSNEYADKVMASPWQGAKKVVEPISKYDAATMIETLIEKLLKAKKGGAEIVGFEMLDGIAQTVALFQAKAILAKAKAVDAEQTRVEQGFAPGTGALAEALIKAKLEAEA